MSSGAETVSLRNHEVEPDEHDAAPDLIDDDELGDELEVELYPDDIKRLLEDPTTQEEDQEEEDEPALNLEPEGPASLESFQQFLNEVGEYKLLSAFEEVQLSKAIEAGVVAQSRLDDIKDSKTLSTEELELDPALEPKEKEFILKLKAIAYEGAQAKQRMINSNLRLVVSIAKRYQGYGIPLADLTQEGIIGLIRGVEKFDWRKGFKFSTYGTWWITQAVQRGLANKGRTIRTPVHVVEREQKLDKAERTLIQRLGREPTHEEIAEEARIPMDKAQAVWEGARATASLNYPVGSDEDGEMGSLIVDENTPDPAEETELSLRHQYIREAVDQLPPREWEVIILRFGFGGPPQTLEAIGKDLHLTRERVRNIEAEALRRLADIAAGKLGQEKTLRPTRSKTNGNRPKYWQ